MRLRCAYKGTPRCNVATTHEITEWQTDGILINGRFIFAFKGQNGPNFIATREHAGLYSANPKDTYEPWRVYRKRCEFFSFTAYSHPPSSTYAYHRNARVELKTEKMKTYFLMHQSSQIVRTREVLKKRE